MSKKTLKHLSDLIDFFENERTCVEFLERQRWNGRTPDCPRCGGNVVTRTTPTGFRCYTCDRPFSVITGTVMDGSKIPLQKWVAALYLVTFEKKGIRPKRLATELGLRRRVVKKMLGAIDEIVSAPPAPVPQPPPQPFESRFSISARRPDGSDWYRVTVEHNGNFAFSDLGVLDEMPF